MIEQFIRERMKGGSPDTVLVLWYRDSFSAFQGVTDSKPAIVHRIGELIQRGLKPVSINTDLRCINAYFRWLHEEHKAELIQFPRLKKEQKILATLSTEQAQRLIRFKPKGTNQSALAGAGAPRYRLALCGGSQPSVGGC